MYFAIDNALDLKRNAFAGCHFGSLAQEIQGFCHIPDPFSLTDSELLAWVQWQDNEAIAATCNIRNICDSKWLTIDLVIDLASNYFTANDLNSAQSFLYETLKEQGVIAFTRGLLQSLSNVKNQKTSINNQIWCCQNLKYNQFTLVYNPKYMTSGLIQGAEVLFTLATRNIRWISRTITMKLLKTTVKLLEWWLGNQTWYCSTISFRWDESWFWTLSINVSVNQLTNLNILNTIKQYLMGMVDASNWFRGYWKALSKT